MLERIQLDFLRAVLARERGQILVRYGLVDDMAIRAAPSFSAGEIELPLAVQAAFAIE